MEMACFHWSCYLPENSKYIREQYHLTCLDFKVTVQTWEEKALGGSYQCEKEMEPDCSCNVVNGQGAQGGIQKILIEQSIKRMLFLLQS